MVQVGYNENCERNIKKNLSSPQPHTHFIASDLNVTGDDGTVSIYNLGDIAWILSCTALVWIMIPGLGFFYSGLLRRKNALSMIYLSVMALAVVSFQVFLPSIQSIALIFHQWFFWGFSLTFSEDASPYIGTLSKRPFLALV